MNRPRFDIGQIIRDWGEEFFSQKSRPYHVKKALGQLLHVARSRLADMWKSVLNVERGISATTAVVTETVPSVSTRTGRYGLTSARKK